MFEISKTWEFAGSHRLTGLPPGHKCARLHGHNWRVTLILSGDLTDGMVKDYGDLKPFGDFIRDQLDHRHLGWGDVCDGDGKVTDPAVLDFNPTAENLAAHLLTAARGMFGLALVEAVRVCETPNTTAEAS